ncbi:Peptidyl-prolyl cis-trans isomerase [Gryllus bimaculatus]|nr:Peptidyl-prolyl cis-trans isomerase [Gryllus bimaculatus]
MVPGTETECWARFSYASILKRVMRNPVYCYEQQKADWKRNVQLLMQISIYKNLITGFKTETPEIGLPKELLVNKPYRCFLDIEAAGGNKLGRLVFEIYSDIVPKTAFNFLAICKGALGLTYKGSPFHRITPGLMCQGGDVTKGNGSGGMSVYGFHFPDENFILRHGGAGVLSMASFGRATNNSIFNITFRPLTSLDGHCVVIGRVIENMKVLYEIQAYGTPTGKPQRDYEGSNQEEK